MYPVFQFEPTVDELNPDLNTIIQDMGYINTGIPESYKNLLDEIFLQSKNNVTPRCGYIVLPEGSVQVFPGTVILDYIAFTTKNIVATPLKKMTGAALFVATVGPEFDEWSRSAFDSGDPLKGYIIDLLGSEIAESIADWINEKIIEYAKKDGLFCSNRYSPGYCGWNVAEQHKLFGFLPDNFCGISLTESALMKPHKSVSGIIGMGKDIEFQDYPCEVCHVSHCYKNRQQNK